MMNRRINELGYLVLALSSYGGKKDQPVKLTTLEDGLSQVFDSQPINFSKSLEDAVELNLVKNRQGEVSATRLGIRFAKLNKERRFETTEEQLTLLRESAHLTRLGKKVVDLLSKGRKNEVDRLSLLAQIFPKKSDEPERQKMIKRAGMRAGNGMSEEDLEEQLRQKRIYGGRAEEFVVKYERERLRKADRIMESELVKRIGHTDIARGYDVESFTDSGRVHDRFIEVKCTKNDFLRFYWSKNEVDTAKRLGDKYFIYFVWIDEHGEPEGQLEIIPNPAKTVFENPTIYEISNGTIVVREL